jgi:hypothetical protein
MLITSRVTSVYMFPYKEDLFRFDFEVAREDEYMCQGIGDGLVKGFMTPPEEHKSAKIVESIERT